MSLYISKTYLIVLLISGCINTHHMDRATPKADATRPAVDCIDEVISQDSYLGKMRNRASETISLSDAIYQYTGAISNLDFQDCPGDFVKAFKRHVSAWSDLLVVTDEYPTMRGEMHELFDRLQAGKHSKIFNPLLASVWDTWEEVLVAKRNIEVADLLPSNVSDCIACQRISLFSQARSLLADGLWEGLDDDAKHPPMLYYTDITTYLAFTDDLFSLKEYHTVQCVGGLTLKKLNGRLDNQPFHMENKMDFEDSSSLFYYRPMMLCSDVETMHEFVPALSSSEDWLQLVMHEYFHSFQFSHKRTIDFLANDIGMSADTLVGLYRQYTWFRMELARENQALLNAIACTEHDSIDHFAHEFLQIRRNRRDRFVHLSDFNLSAMENFWETIEGTARYIEYYLADTFKALSRNDGLNCDTLFNHFAFYLDDSDFEEKEVFQQRTLIMEAYYYVTGFNLCRLMDKIGIAYKDDRFEYPDTSLHDILVRHMDRRNH